MESWRILVIKHYFKGDLDKVLTLVERRDVGKSIGLEKDKHPSYLKIMRVRL